MPRVKPPLLRFTASGQTQLADAVTDLAWSPQGDRVAAISAGGEVWLHDSGLNGPGTCLQSVHDRSLTRAAFSAQGTFLAALGQAGHLALWHLTSIPTAIALPSSTEQPWLDTLAWHPTQPILAYGVGATVVVWDAARAIQLTALEFQDSSVLHLAWQPSGDRLAVSGHGGVKVWTMADWTAAPTRIAVPGASLHCAWSADGRYLASGNLDRTLTVFAWDSPPPWLMQGFPGKVRQVAWSSPGTPAGSPIVAAACVEGITVWTQTTGTGQWQSRVLQHHRQRVNAIAWHPQQPYLASAGEDGHLVGWRQGKTLDHTLKLDAAVTQLAWSPTGHALLAGTRQGDLRLWAVSAAAQGFG